MKHGTKTSFEKLKYFIYYFHNFVANVYKYFIIMLLTIRNVVKKIIEKNNFLYDVEINDMFVILNYKIYTHFF